MHLLPAIAPVIWHLRCRSQRCSPLPSISATAAASSVFVCCRIVSCIVAVIAIVVVVVVVVSLLLAALLARMPFSSSLTSKWLVVAFPPQPSSTTRPEVRSGPLLAGIAPSASSSSTPLPGRRITSSQSALSDEPCSDRRRGGVRLKLVRVV